MLPVSSLVRRSVLQVALLDANALAASWRHDADAVALHIPNPSSSELRTARAGTWRTVSGSGLERGASLGPAACRAAGVGFCAWSAAGFGAAGAGGTILLAA